MKKENREGVNLSFDFGGILKGLGNLFEMAKELSEKDGKEFRKEGEFKASDEKGMKAVYGISVKFGGNGPPSVQQFGNIRKETKKGPVVEDIREPMIDLFDEGDFFLVVVEMPGVIESNIKLDVNGDIFTVSCLTGDRKYNKELLLPSSVDSKKTTHSYKNGILEAKLWKAEKG